MPGRYRKPAGTVRGADHASARPSRALTVLGLLASAALIAAGVVAFTGGDSTADAVAQSAGGGSAAHDAERVPAREAGQLSRSKTREPGRGAHALPKPAPDEPLLRAHVIGGSGQAPDGSANEDSPHPEGKPAATEPLPEDSGSGRRVVYDITAQQVWLVEDGNDVVHTYKVSGSRYDQLAEGTYEVFSTSEDAISWTLEETMRYMVRFHRGENSNIGFHDIPVYRDSGEEVQTLAELGTPLSDGCIRQDPEDAKALWDFAPVGTTVVVVRS